MKDLAPDIVRQRCLVEGFASRKVVEADIRDYFKSVTGRLGLRAYGEPTIFSPGGIGKDGNQGFDAFIPLIDSGISLYYWASRDFVSIVIYTCKSFDEAVAVEATKEFFGFKDAAWQSF
ncbi:hypothetical protein AUJ14_05420 [Candidatus Micrarchaeota archaeon CG1_02_55_22]|nr:MAG: hypothetical protein AUJ14_05420 [Candidatus Micrarchaeota archaeon CG1_02_55_22]